MRRGRRGLWAGPPGPAPLPEVGTVRPERGVWGVDVADDYE